MSTLFEAVEFSNDGHAIERSIEGLGFCMASQHFE
jgi:hypothetical protein